TPSSAMNHSHDSASALRADSWELATTSASPAARLWSWSHTTCWYSTPASSNNRSSSSIAGDSSLEAVTITAVSTPASPGRAEAHASVVASLGFVTTQIPVMWYLAKELGGFLAEPTTLTFGPAAPNAKAFAIGQ